MEQTLNQLLVEMDGMDTAEGTIVFAATNRADLLDKALLRAGRFDRHIFVDLPNLAERRELLQMYTAKYRLASSVNQTELVDRLTNWTTGMSGADIARLCNEAALVAARRGDCAAEGVLRDDFEVAFERILAGLLPVKVSIVPRTSSGQETASSDLGFTQLVQEERRLFNTDELKDRMAVLLGGRAAEQVIFNAVSDASQRYLRAATDLALKQVRQWGMSDRIGHLSFDADPSGNEFVPKPYSQRTQQLIEQEAQVLVVQSFARCVQLIGEHERELRALINALLAKEVITFDELIALLGQRPSGAAGGVA